MRPTRGWNRPGLRPGGKAHGVFDGACCILNQRVHSRPGGSTADRWASKTRHGSRIGKYSHKREKLNYNGECMFGIKKFSYNTEPPDPEIINILQKYGYIGLTVKDDPINPIAKEMSDWIVWDIGRLKQYLTIYSFQYGINQYYLCERTANIDIEWRYHTLIFKRGNTPNIGLEIASDSNFMNNDIKTIEQKGQYYCRARGKKEYERLQDKILPIISAINKLNVKSYSFSFYIFGNEDLAGFSKSGGKISHSEIEIAINILRDIL